MTEPTSTASPNAAARRRQMLLLAGIGGLILAGAVLSVSLTSERGRSAPPAKPKMTNILTPGAQIDPRDAWRGQADAQLKAIEERSRELSQHEAQRETQAREMMDRLARLEASNLTPLPPPPRNAPALRPEFGPDRVGPAGVAPLPVPQAPPVSPMPLVPPAQKPPPAGLGNASAGVTNPGAIISIRLDAPATPAGANASPARAGKDTGRGTASLARDTRSYLPSGSFTRALLLGGLDAPTGGQSQQNPQPVLLKLMDHAMLPNRFRAQVKECFVVGAGYGDVSAERAYIRTESLSCVTRLGQAIDVPLKGYVAGEDGKAGMRGRLVSKQGQILANALLAGVASGIGSAFQQNATTVSVSPLGTTGTVDANKQLQAGLGSGVGKALDRLAQYYITLAEKVFPVIEIDAGRSVDVVLTQGAALPQALDGPDADTLAYPFLSNRTPPTRSPDDEED